MIEYSLEQCSEPVKLIQLGDKKNVLWGDVM